MLRSRQVLALSLLLMCEPVMAEWPNCDDHIAAMSFVFLKNAKRLTNESVDFNATTVERIASESIGKGRGKQVHLVTYWLKNGKGFIKAIAISGWEDDECSFDMLYTVEEELR